MTRVALSCWLRKRSLCGYESSDTPDRTFGKVLDEGNTACVEPRSLVKVGGRNLTVFSLHVIPKAKTVARCTRGGESTMGKQFSS